MCIYHINMYSLCVYIYMYEYEPHKDMQNIGVYIVYLSTYLCLKPQ